MTNATGSNTVTLNAGDVLQIQSAAERAGARLRQRHERIDGHGDRAPRGLRRQRLHVHPGQSVGVRPHRGDQLPVRDAAQRLPRHAALQHERAAERGQPVVGAAVRQDRRHHQRDDAVGRSCRRPVLTSPINAGQVVLLRGDDALPPDGNNPVIVGQYMESTYKFGTACVNSAAGSGPQDCGDPAMSLAVATPQFRTSYQFIAPPSYSENWVNVIAPNGATVKVDGTTVTVTRASDRRAATRSPTWRSAAAPAAACTPRRAPLPSASRSTGTASTRATCTLAG